MEQPPILNAHNKSEDKCMHTAETYYLVLKTKEHKNKKETWK